MVGTHPSGMLCPKVSKSRVLMIPEKCLGIPHSRTIYHGIANTCITLDTAVLPTFPLQMSVKLRVGGGGLSRSRTVTRMCIMHTFYTEPEFVKV